MINCIQVNLLCSLKMGTGNGYYSVTVYFTLTTDLLVASPNDSVREATLIPKKFCSSGKFPSNGYVLDIIMVCVWACFLNMSQNTPCLVYDSLWRGQMRGAQTNKVSNVTPVKISQVQSP